MLFVDPEKLEKLVDAVQDCLLDVREAQGMQVSLGRIDRFGTQIKALAFLTMVTDQGPFVQGGTVFISGFGTDKPVQWPIKPVQFNKGT